MIPYSSVVLDMGEWYGLLADIRPISRQPYFHAFWVQYGGRRGVQPPTLDTIILF